MPPKEPFGEESAEETSEPLALPFRDGRVWAALAMNFRMGAGRVDFRGPTAFPLDTSESGRRPFAVTILLINLSS